MSSGPPRSATSPSSRPWVPGLVLDIGCGRGEMLSLLEEAGHDVIGVDTDAGMVAACQAKGLPALHEDGIHYLSRASDETLKGIFCAQVVEHLITPELERLISLSQQKLKRGGVLVVETINPRSSFALGNHFYADTSHVRPVHPETLRYICEQVGFTRVQLEERSPHPLLETSRRASRRSRGRGGRGAARERVRVPGLRDRRHQVSLHVFENGVGGQAIGARR